MWPATVSVRSDAGVALASSWCRSARKQSPAARLMAPIERIAFSRPIAGINTKAPASAPTNAPAVLKPYTAECKRVASSRSLESPWVSSGMVPPIKIVGGKTSSAESPTSNANASAGVP